MEAQMASDKEKAWTWTAIFLITAVGGGAESFGSWQHSGSAGWFAAALLSLVAWAVVRLIMVEERISLVQLLLAAEFGKEDDYYKKLEEAQREFTEEMREEEEKIKKDPDRVHSIGYESNLRPVLRHPRLPTNLLITRELGRINSHLERLTKATEQTASVSGKTPPSA
jgi:hypothetical protein